MPTSREILESTYRMGRMKKVRMFVLAGQIILTIIMIIILTQIMPEVSFDPLYFPIEVFIFIIAVVILIMFAEGFFFKLFSLRWAKSDSEKFLMAKDDIRKGIVVIIIAAIIIALVTVFMPVMDENIDIKESTRVKGEYNRTFTSQDAFAVTGVKSISVNSEDGVLLDIHILRKNDFEREYYMKHLNTKEWDGIDRLHYESEEFLSHGDYVLYIDAKGANANVTYTIESSVSQPLTLYLTVFPLILIIMNAVWIVYLLPLKKRYEKTSIYE